MTQEERVMRAREVLAETPHADDCRYIMAVREGDEDAHYVDCTCDRPTRATLAFADEDSGIGELRAKATDLINAYDEAKDTGGHYLWQVVEGKADALRAALSQSS